ncbi:MAG: hypothetical protein ACLUQB_00860 [Lachnospiraceae bacterium]
MRRTMQAGLVTLMSLGKGGGVPRDYQSSFYKKKIRYFSMQSMVI